MINDKKKELKIKKEFKELIPALTKEEFTMLEQNIINEGCRDAIVLWQGYIIDGHNRYEICTKHNIEFSTISMDFADENDVKIWIIQNQFGRRNINNYTRSILALQLEDLFREKAKKNHSLNGGDKKSPCQKSDTPIRKINTNKELAKIANVSHDTIAKVKKIEKEAPLEVKEKLKNGEISINEAYKEIKSIEKIKKLEQAKQKILEQTRQQIKDDKPIVSLESYETWLDKQPQCDLLITDPPYSTDVDDIVSFANDWLPKALNKVKDTGRAYVFIGAYPKELKAYLNVVLPKHIVLEQILIWTYKNTLGNNPKDRYKLNYQNCLYFKGVNAGDLDCPVINEQWAVMEINAPDGRLGNRFHTWQKPDELAERLIRHSTKPNDIVLDCFCCTGTFLIAANKLGRKGFGCDISKDNLDIAIDRGCSYEQ